MYTLARQLLFKLSPETSHDLSLDLIGAGGRLGLLNGALFIGWRIICVGAGSRKRWVSQPICY
jgi:hypothetical protein